MVKFLSIAFLGALVFAGTQGQAPPSGKSNADQEQAFIQTKTDIKIDGAKGGQLHVNLAGDYVIRDIFRVISNLKAACHKARVANPAADCRGPLMQIHGNVLNIIFCGLEMLDLIHNHHQKNGGVTPQESTTAATPANYPGIYPDRYPLDIPGIMTDLLPRVWPVPDSLPKLGDKDKDIPTIKIVVQHEPAAPRIYDPGFAPPINRLPICSPNNFMFCVPPQLPYWTNPYFDLDPYFDLPTRFPQNRWPTRRPIKPITAPPAVTEAPVTKPAEPADFTRSGDFTRAPEFTKSAATDAPTTPVYQPDWKILEPKGERTKQPATPTPSPVTQGTTLKLIGI